MLIEDNFEVRENTSELLELADYTVVTAENGKIGVQKAKELLPDLIICDIMMPELDGYGVLQLLSKNTVTNSIPFIFLSAKSEKSDFRKGMSLGADDYLTKPFDEMDLINAIETRLKRSEMMHSDIPKTTEGLNSFIHKANLETVIGDKTAKKYAKKEIVFREGDYANNVYLLESGKVKLSRINDEGKELITTLLNKGDYFGYQAILLESEQTETATILEESEICLIGKHEFLDLINSNIDVSTKFIKMLSNELEHKEQELIDLAYNTVRKRVIDSLLKLKEKYEMESVEVNFSMPISRGDLAGMVGTAKESVIRYLSEFKEEGLISIKGSEITILDEEGLKKIVC